MEATYAPEFSIGIPNYNYGRYIVETIESVLAQDLRDMEVLVSDNASTDDSVALVAGIDDDRLKLSVNPMNLGFAANLDRALGPATGRILILLSSDDVMLAGALSTYHRIFDAAKTERLVISSTVLTIDSQGRDRPPRPRFPAFGRALELVEDVSAHSGVEVVELDSEVLLRRSLLTLGNPFNFASTAYSRSLYEEVGGFGGRKLMNPDKWLNWRLIDKAERVMFVRDPLFAYRWHDANQTALESAAGVSKLLVDDYVSTFELTDDLLDRAGVTREDLREAFVEHDIARHGLATLARGNVDLARKTANFGRATYPVEFRRNRLGLALRFLLRLGPLGPRLADTAYRRTTSTRR